MSRGRVEHDTDLARPGLVHAVSTRKADALGSGRPVKRLPQWELDMQSKRRGVEFDALGKVMIAWKEYSDALLGLEEVIPAKDHEGAMSAAGEVNNALAFLAKMREMQRRKFVRG